MFCSTQRAGKVNLGLRGRSGAVVLPGTSFAVVSATAFDVGSRSRMRLEELVDMCLGCRG